jgi:hypothetical protein
MKLKRFALSAAALFASLPSCNCGGTYHPPPPPPTGRCDVDLTSFTTSQGSGTFATQISQASDLMTGDFAQGQLGDYLLGNDRLRVIIQQPGRHIGPDPYGGALIDGSLVNSDGSTWTSFGKLAVLYNFGRTVDTQKVEVVTNGYTGGSAVVAATGQDALNNAVDLASLFAQLGFQLVPNPSASMNLLITTYYVLSPGDNRVRVITGFCNQGMTALALPVGDYIDAGGSVELFNSLSRTQGLGYSVGADEMIWYGWQGNGVAYGYVPYFPGTEGPGLDNVTLNVNGATFTLLGAPGEAGLATWTDASVTTHPGELDIAAGSSNILVRDFIVGQDLGEVASFIHTYNAPVLSYPTGGVRGTVTQGGKPVAGARVAAFRPSATTPKGPSCNPGPLATPRALLETVYTTQSDGTFTGTLPSDDYQFSAWTPGSVPTTPKSITVGESGTVQAALDIAATNQLTVSVADVSGSPLPAKVTVSCLPPAGSNVPTCLAPPSGQQIYRDAARDPVPDGVQAMALVPPTGTLTLPLPPAQYQVTVTRGPQYSIWPLTGYPGQMVDLTSGNASVNAVLARVVNTTGWMGADLHAHAVNSPDSAVAHTDRVLSFLAEGVDVLGETDHDDVTDLGSAVTTVGGTTLVAPVIGDELSPFDYGHFNVFPIPINTGDILGGAIDWAGGEGASLRLDQIYAAAQMQSAVTIQIDNPRGAGGQYDTPPGAPVGVMGALQVDTDTLATHADPAAFRMVAASGATSSNTNLFPITGFTAYEVMNPTADGYDPMKARPAFNDWFVMLSRGLLAAGTANSDTHALFSMPAGYPRTFVQMANSSISAFNATTMATALNKMQAVGSLGPFVQLTGEALDSSGQPVAGTQTSVGGVLPSLGRNILFTVDIQVAPWYDAVEIDLMTHAGTDGSCSMPSLPTDSRFGCKGQGSTNWPASGIASTIMLTSTDFVTETAATGGGVTYTRLHATKTIPITAPAGDTWFLAMVYGSASMFPAVYAGLDSSNQPVPVKPFAFTNPILVDADGGGYNHPPYTP